METITPFKNRVIVQDIESGEKKLKSGLIIPDDDGKDRGIRPRWATVHSVGPEVEDLKPGDQVLLAHGRWTRGFDLQTENGTLNIRGIDYPEAVLLVKENNNETV